MSFKILPQEINEEPTRFCIKTRVPYLEITDEMIIERVKNANLSAGDVVRVMATTHEYDEVLAQAHYLVRVRKDSLEVVTVTDRDTRQVNKVDIQVSRLGEWLTFAKPAAAPEVTPAAVAALNEALKPAKGKKAA